MEVVDMQSTAGVATLAGAYPPEWHAPAPAREPGVEEL
jgi:hypothetical protein